MAWKLYEGDCFDYLPLLEDKSIDMILCDLPYGVIDSNWDFTYDKSNQINHKKLFEEYRRILTSKGTLLLFGTEPFSTSLRVLALDLYKYDHIWLKNKVVGFIHAKNKPLKDFEIISVFSKGQTFHKNKTKNRMTYNPQGVEKIDNPKLRKRKTKNDCLLNTTKEQTYVKEFYNYPRMTIKMDFRGERSHPSQKPVALFEYLIKTYTNEGDLVLDNCAGSGTTGVACENTGRNSIMMEKEPEYCQIIKDRMATVQELQLEARKQKTLNEFNGQATLDMPAK